MTTMSTTNLSEQIRELREKTGAGMMDCKKALTESGGDFEKAVEILRKKGLSSAAKKAGRATKEGLLAAAVSADGKAGAIVELNCETDFVAKTDEFQTLVGELARQAAEGKLAKPEDGEAQVKALVAKLGENMGLRRLDRFALSGSGLIAHYVHTVGGKKGALLELACASDAIAKHPAVSALGKELGMQIVALEPSWLTREEVPADAIAKEREIYGEQVRKEGKPEAAVPKIVEGKVQKLFFQRVCLLEQVSMRDNKTPVKQLVADAAKAAGGSVEVKRFVRYLLGE